ncbi:hypothetical protein [Sphingobium terrigena]|nr:hypothetical protein [Sphingobium terrigena]
MKTPVRSRIFLPDLPISDPGVPVDTICEFERIDGLQRVNLLRTT